MLFWLGDFELDQFFSFRNVVCGDEFSGVEFDGFSGLVVDQGSDWGWGVAVGVVVEAGNGDWGQTTVA